VAHDLTAAAETAISSFAVRMAEIVAGWARIFTIESGQLDQSYLKLVDYSGIGDHSAQAADGAVPAGADLTAHGSAYSRAAYEKRVAMTQIMLDQNPNMPAEVGAQMADSAANTIAQMAWTLLAAPDTTEHPDGDYTAVGGGTVYLADNFATPVAQTNMTTGALSHTTLLAAFAILRGYLNKNSQPADLAAGRLALVVPVDLEKTARDLKARASEIYDGSGLQNSTGYAVDEIIINPYTTDATDWTLINLDRNPFGIWLPRMPSLRHELYTGAGRVEFYSSYQAGTFLKPAEHGFVFNKAA
jgi:hypothetical protein